MNGSSYGHPTLQLYSLFKLNATFDINPKVQLYIFIICYRFVIYVNNKKMYTDIDANDGTWHHVLVTWSSNRGAWKMYKNAFLWDQGYNLAAGETIKGDLRLKKDFENICLTSSFFFF